jgi:hypothetical protein
MSEEKEKKNKKISQMTLDEIEKAITKSKETMNGENSMYIRHLKDRKAELTKK